SSSGGEVNPRRAEALCGFFLSTPATLSLFECFLDGNFWGWLAQRSCSLQPARFRRHSPGSILRLFKTYRSPVAASCCDCRRATDGVAAARHSIRRDRATLWTLSFRQHGGFLAGRLRRGSSPAGVLRRRILCRRGGGFIVACRACGRRSVRLAIAGRRQGKKNGERRLVTRGCDGLLSAAALLGLAGAGADFLRRREISRFLPQLGARVRSPAGFRSAERLAGFAAGRIARPAGCRELAVPGGPPGCADAPRGLSVRVACRSAGRLGSCGASGSAAVFHFTCALREHPGRPGAVRHWFAPLGPGTRRLARLPLPVRVGRGARKAGLRW